MSLPQARLATLDDLRALDPDAGWELLAGSLVQKAAPTFQHGWTQRRVGRVAEASGGGWKDRRGGWWIVSEVEVRLSPHDVVRPDLAGWRRSALPEMPETWPVDVRPDWVCEVLSDSTRGRDLATKQRLFHAQGVPWLWFADPRAHLVQVLRWEPEGYLIVATAVPGERRGLPPFDDVPLDVSEAFGLEDSAEE